MQISVDLDGAEPLFAQLIGQIKSAVRAGDLGPGDPLLAHTADERIDRAALVSTGAALRDLLADLGVGVGEEADATG